MYRKIFFISVLLTHLFWSNQASAQMDPKTKALVSTSLYGTIGGALLGTAALAFGADGRWIAKGASLGLYSGLLFGSYIIVSHEWNKNRPSGEPDPDQPYGGEETGEEEEAYGQQSDEGEEVHQFRRFRAMWELENQQESLSPIRGKIQQSGTNPFMIYVPVIHFQF